MRPTGIHLGHGLSAAHRRLYLEIPAPEPARSGFEKILFVVYQQDVAWPFH
jgi:hypothetical protein